MREILITFAEVADNLADHISRAHSERVTFVILKHGSPVARLEPYSTKVFTGRDFAEVLAKNELSESDAKSWRRDLREARQSLKPPHRRRS